MKTKSFLLTRNLIIASFFIFAILLMARETGKIGRTKLSGTPGCTCHGASPTESVNVIIDGPSTLNIGESANYTVTISNGPLAAAGTNVAVSSGDLNTVDGTLRKENGELTHVAPKPPTDNQVVYAFEFTAPSTEGEVTMAANGNSVNVNHSPSGDQWNFAENKTITIQNTTAISDINPGTPVSFGLEQNYPNPFNPVTKISYNLDKAGNVQLNVYDALGKVVTKLVDNYQPSGSYTVNFNGEYLQSGVYVYRLTAGKRVISKRMLLIK